MLLRGPWEIRGGIGQVDGTPATQATPELNRLNRTHAIHRAYQHHMDLLFKPTNYQQDFSSFVTQGHEKTTSMITHFSPVYILKSRKPRKIKVGTD